MKTISKYNFKKLLTKSSALLALILLMPLNSLALGANASKSSTASSAFCTNFATESAKVTAKMSDLSTKLSTAHSQQSQNLISREQADDQKVVNARAKSDATRATNFATLESKATNDAQKQAVQTYETAVKAAISARRASYDSAKVTFRNSLQDVIDSKQTSVNTQLASFTDAVNSAIATAQASCTATPTNGATIRVTFIASMKSARSIFVSGRSSDANVGSQVKQLVATRNASFKTADAAFQTAIAAARDALKTAFTKTN